VMAPVEKFHAHLDLCPQCREHPLELCASGHRLLLDMAGPSKPYSMSSSVSPESSPSGSSKPK
jgi:hypothetical protein